MNITDFLRDHFKDALYIGGAVVSFFVGTKLRKLNVKKEEVNVQTSELENVEAALKIYRLMLTDLQEKLKKAEEAYMVIEERLHASIENNKTLSDENKKLKSQLNEITGNS